MAEWNWLSTLKNIMGVSDSTSVPTDIAAQQQPTIEMKIAEAVANVEVDLGDIKDMPPPPQSIPPTVAAATAVPTEKKEMVPAVPVAAPEKKEQSKEVQPVVADTKTDVPQCITSALEEVINLSHRFPSNNRFHFTLPKSLKEIEHRVRTYRFYQKALIECSALERETQMIAYALERHSTKKSLQSQPGHLQPAEIQQIQQNRAAVLGAAAVVEQQIKIYKQQLQATAPDWLVFVMHVLWFHLKEGDFVWLRSKTHQQLLERYQIKGLCVRHNPPEANKQTVFKMHLRQDRHNRHESCSFMIESPLTLKQLGANNETTFDIYPSPWGGSEFERFLLSSLQLNKPLLFASS